MGTLPLRGKTLYVTGGSAGIGLALSKQAAAKGANLLLLARDAGRLATAAAEVRAAGKPGVRVEARALDVTDRARVAEVLAEAVASFGPPDVLVNNAGRALPRRFDDVTPEQFDATLRLNLAAPRDTIAALLPHLRARRGAILNVSSMAGFVGVYGYTDYSASKFGLIGFSEALRQELKPDGVTVQVLCPPDTDTPGFANENREKPAETRALSKGASLLTADDVARAALAALGTSTFLIVPGLPGKAALLAKRLVPGLLAWGLDRIVLKSRATER
jgi:short-subunit dehydrogenase